MKFEEYKRQLKSLQYDRSLICGEFFEKMAELQAEYLAEQVVATPEKAIALILEARQRGELPELDMVPVPEIDWECELLELNDNGKPDNATWRCRNDNFVIDVAAEDGEVNLIFV